MNFKKPFGACARATNKQFFCSSSPKPTEAAQKYFLFCWLFYCKLFFVVFSFASLALLFVIRLPLLIFSIYRHNFGHFAGFSLLSENFFFRRVYGEKWRKVDDLLPTSSFRVEKKAGKNSKHEKFHHQLL